MDTRAHRLANLLVGNPQDEATLEITLTGPTLRFDESGCIAISGADLQPTVNDQPILNNRPLIVRKGDVLAFGARAAGLRAYIAWHGGIELSHMLNSKSTYLRGGFGGYHGRALRKGDVLQMRATLGEHELDELEQNLWQIKVYLPATLGMLSRTSVRVVRGAHTGLFTSESLQRFFLDEFRIGPQSERMGYRLEGPRLSLINTTQLPSEATSFGSVQVPPDGNPIVLMADRQTTGGYAKIAHVATVDLSAVAQCMPGDSLRFTECTLTEAQRLDSLREEAFGQLHQALQPLRDLLDRRSVA